MRRLPVLVVASIVLAGSLTAAPDDAREVHAVADVRWPRSATGIDPATDRPVGERQRHRRHADLDADDQHGRHRLHRAAQHDVRLRLHDASPPSPRARRRRRPTARAPARSTTCSGRCSRTGTASTRTRRPPSWAASRPGTRTAPRTRPTPAATTTATRPTRATRCALDNTRARDINSGTTTSLVLHRPRPGSPPLLGLRVRAAGQHQRGPAASRSSRPSRSTTTAAAASICIQLSWDGGASWTATKQVNVTNSLDDLHARLGDRHLGPHVDARPAEHDQLPRPDHRRVLAEREGLRPRRHPGPGQLHPVDSGG